jgi:hypothetical protein
MTSWPETDSVELTRRQVASRRDVKSICVLNALPSTVIWHPVVVEVTDTSVM